VARRPAPAPMLVWIGKQTLTAIRLKGDVGTQIFRLGPSAGVKIERVLTYRLPALPSLRWPIAEHGK
jgi:hypothetical protein